MSERNQAPGPGHDDWERRPGADEPPRPGEAEEPAAIPPLPIGSDEPEAVPPEPVAEAVPLPDPALPSSILPLPGEERPGDLFPAPLDPAAARARRGLLAWFFVLLVLGTAGLAVGQTETAALVALGALLAAAQAAEVDARSRLSYQLVGWIVPTVTIATFLALGGLLAYGNLHGPARAIAVASAAVGAVGMAALLAPGALDGLTRALFPGEPPRPVLRLTARLVAFGILLAAPAWFSFDSMRESLLSRPESLMDPSHLSGGLLGYILLAAGGVGWLVRRGARDALARLGIVRPLPRDLIVAVLGVAALVALNAGGDALQHRWFPRLWASDHEFTRALARNMAPAQGVLLGLSAGIGEEITLRGALQPRLGLLLTSLFFAALHVQYSWWGMVMILCLGLLLGLIRQRSSTTVAILVHVVYDVLAVFGD